MWKTIPGYHNYECSEDMRAGVRVRSAKRSRQGMGLSAKKPKPAVILNQRMGRYRLTHPVNKQARMFLPSVIWDATFRGKELTPITQGNR